MSDKGIDRIDEVFHTCENCHANEEDYMGAIATLAAVMHYKLSPAQQAKVAMSLLCGLAEIQPEPDMAFDAVIAAMQDAWRKGRAAEGN